MTEIAADRSRDMSEPQSPTSVSPSVSQSSSVSQSQQTAHTNLTAGVYTKSTGLCWNGRSIPAKNTNPITRSIVRLTTPSMASTMSFADWRQVSGESLMQTAESLLDKLENVAELLTEIDEKYISGGKSPDEIDEVQASIISQFHEGVDSARNVVGVLKREKWRLSKREMSVELKMGELEDYKSHLKSDMSSLNQTVDVLSMRVVQLENQLAEAQDVQETLEAEIAEHKKQHEQEESKIKSLRSDNEALRKEVKIYRQHTNHTLTTENELMKNEVLILQDENHRLKELVRNAETHQEYHKETDGDYLSRLTNDFLKELSSLEVENKIHSNHTNSTTPKPSDDVT